MAAQPRMINPKNRLASISEGGMGRTPQDLISEADRLVSIAEPRLRAHVSTTLDELLRFSAAPDDVLYAESRVIGALALSIAEVAGNVGMTTVGEIARGISAMVKTMLPRGDWHSGAVRLHLQTLALASKAADDAAPENRLMLDRLRMMREALKVME